MLSKCAKCDEPMEYGSDLCDRCWHEDPTWDEDACLYCPTCGNYTDMPGDMCHICHYEGLL